jgi:hypothetical protein
VLLAFLRKMGEFRELLLSSQNSRWRNHGRAGLKMVEGLLLYRRFQSDPNATRRRTGESQSIESHRSCQ